MRHGNPPDYSYCGKLADHVTRLYGEVNFANVIKALESMKDPILRPTGVSMPRLAAMTVRIVRGTYNPWEDAL